MIICDAIAKLTDDQKRLLSYMLDKIDEDYIEINEVDFYEFNYEGNLREDVQVLSQLPIQYREDEDIITFSVFDEYYITKNNSLVCKFNKKSLQVLLKQMPLNTGDKVSEMLSYLKNDGWQQCIGYIFDIVPRVEPQLMSAKDWEAMLESFKDAKSLQLRLPAVTNSGKSSLYYSLFYSQHNKKFHLFSTRKEDKHTLHRYYSSQEFSHLEGLIIRDIYTDGDKDYYNKLWIARNLKTGYILSK